MNLEFKMGVETIRKSRMPKCDDTRGFSKEEIELLNQIRGLPVNVQNDIFDLLNKRDFYKTQYEKLLDLIDETHESVFED